MNYSIRMQMYNALLLHLPSRLNLHELTSRSGSIVSSTFEAALAPPPSSSTVGPPHSNHERALQVGRDVVNRRSTVANQSPPVCILAKP